MDSMRKRILIFGFFAALAGFLFGLYKYFQPVPGVASLNTDYTLNATALFSEYMENEALADSMYVRKIIEVSGAVIEKSEEWKSIDGDSVLVQSVLLDGGDGMTGVACQFAELPEKSDWNEIQPGSSIRVKGECNGMLFDVVLSRAVLLTVEHLE